MSYIRKISVIYDDNDSAPNNCIKEVNGRKQDVNAGFGGKFVWLLANHTNDRYNAATHFDILISKDPIDGLEDLAAGAGGDYRYIKSTHDHRDDGRVTNVALYRKSNGDGPVTLDDAAKAGFNRVSSDLNAGRGGDYLQLVYHVA